MARARTPYLIPRRHIRNRTSTHASVPGSRARAEQHLSDLFENATIGLLWVDAKGRVLEANPAQCDLFGQPADQCLGRPLSKFHVDPAVIADLMCRLNERGLVRGFPGRILRPDASMRHVLMDGRTLFEAGRFIRAVLFVRDITIREELQSELLKTSEREQQRLGRELHDGLGQHLHALYYLATLLQKGLIEEGSIHSDEAARLAKQLDEALELTRGVARGLQPVAPVPEGLMAALRELAARVRTLYRVDCHFQCRKPVFFAKNAVATHLYRVAQEAVNNALKHAHPSRIRISMTAADGLIVVRVKDDGIGLRELRRDHKRMGLHIMQYRADAINGSLAFRQPPTKGTEVVCTVPIEPAALPPATRR